MQLLTAIGKSILSSFMQEISSISSITFILTSPQELFLMEHVKHKKMTFNSTQQGSSILILMLFSSLISALSKEPTVKEALNKLWSLQPQLDFT